VQQIPSVSVSLILHIFQFKLTIMIYIDKNIYIQFCEDLMRILSKTLSVKQKDVLSTHTN